MQCTNCILDSTDDPAISFDADGMCSHCRDYQAFEHKFVIKGEAGRKKLEEVVDQIKRSGAGKPYDCILGLSGGVDSSYLALKASQLGLRPLAVHFDNGWNSELAVKNIENIVTKLNIHLHTLVVDWEEFRNLQLAFLRASVVDIEMVSDHAIIATLYKLAIKHDIKYILSGTNYVTEAILPVHWIHRKADHVHIQAIQKEWVGTPLRTYPLFDLKTRVMADLKRIQSVSILNYINYDKQQAKEELKQQLGWRDYGGKHFYQGYILPVKFKIDKRKAHLSTLICSGQLSREEALAEMMRPIYDETLFRTDYDFVIKKLGLTPEEFNSIMEQPVRSHFDYPVEKEIYDRFPSLRMVRPGWQWFKSKVLQK
jgi:N-acetyl sugar amidotransferase